MRCAGAGPEREESTTLRDEWIAREPGAALRSESVQVWRLRLAATPERQAQLASVLSADERERARRFRRDEDRRRFVVCRATLRALVGSCLASPPAELRFRYGEHGKPALDGDAGLEFNVSHSGDVALVAIALDRRIGVDVERHRSVDIDDLAARFFSDDERRGIVGSEGAEKLARFYACWTRKEAYLKATGRGLSLPLDRFSVSIVEPAAVVRDADDPDAAIRWQLATLAAGAGYSAAVAIEGGGTSIELCEFPAL